jgi:O-acetyl-ADP-ribose deacetylase (regulator of RNase III)
MCVFFFFEWCEDPIKKEMELQTTTLTVFYGDITKLNVEAIVNASNEAGAGCPCPTHCIDGAIHAAAGPDLLKASYELNGIPTTVAKITSGFELPCRYVIHCTGPKKQKDGVCDFEALAKSYENILNLARKHNIKELALCCLSTGVFGFPKKQSAQIAIETTKKWLKRHDQIYTFGKLIFCTYTQEDYELYSKLIY